MSKIRRPTIRNLPTAKQMLRNSPPQSQNLSSVLQKLMSETQNSPPQIANLNGALPNSPALASLTTAQEQIQAMLSQGQIPDQNLNISGLELSDLSALPKDIAPKRLPEQTAKPAKPAKLTLEIAFLYEKLGNLVATFSPIDGALISAGAIERAEELMAIGRINPAFMKVLKQLVSGNAYIQAILGHGMVAMAIMANHGIIPASKVSDLFTQSLTDGLKNAAADAA